MKYKNIKTEVNGRIFSSKREAKRYGELLLLEKAKIISQLVLQPKFVFELNGVKICSYVGDFGYIENHKAVIEDVKSPSTSKNRAYRIKHKLMKAFYDIDILET